MGWYCLKRLPGFSPWFLFFWLLVAPWDLHFSTTMMNQSLAIDGGILFYIGMMESAPSLTIGWISPVLGNLMMGFGFFWVMQLHLSWVMLIPLALYSMADQIRKGQWRSALLFPALGALPMLALLAPTFIHYGFSVFRDLKGNAAGINWDNILRPWILLGRFLSYASFELPRFLGEHTHERVAYLLESPWLAGPGFFLWAAGIFQCVLMLVLFFVRRHPRADWPAVKGVTLYFLATLYLEYWFSRKAPASHGFYEALPMVMIYSFYCWDYLAAKPFWRKAGLVFIVCAVYFQIGYLWKEDGRRQSVYFLYRAQMAQAIEHQDYRLLAERRDYAKY